MTMKEFMENCTGCGGNWGKMLLTGIERVFPNDYSEVLEHYDNMDFSGGGVKPFMYLVNWLEYHGVIME